MDNYEKLIAAGAENLHPKFIAVVDGQKQFVAEVIDGVVYLTEAGKKFLAEGDADEAKPVRKGKKQVESANKSASDADDLDLSV